MQNYLARVKGFQGRTIYEEEESTHVLKQKPSTQWSEKLMFIGHYLTGTCICVHTHTSTLPAHICVGPEPASKMQEQPSIISCHPAWHRAMQSRQSSS